MKYYLIISLSCVFLSSFQTKLTNNLSEDDNTWPSNKISEYSGLYHFGESEGETTLIVICHEKEIIAQIGSSYYDTISNMFKGHYLNLSGVKIDTIGNFISDQYSGQFIKTEYRPNKYSYGLKINNCWTTSLDNETETETGHKLSRKIENHFDGIFGYTSYRKLDSNELCNLSTTDLKIMRNEIFARYGYKFTADGDMEMYFTKTDWYKAQHSEINEFLTSIELYNIELIRSEEKKR